jgi:hypothetical protein
LEIVRKDPLIVPDLTPEQEDVLMDVTHRERTQPKVAKYATEHGMTEQQLQEYLDAWDGQSPDPLALGYYEIIDEVIEELFNA